MPAEPLFAARCPQCGRDGGGERCDACGYDATAAGELNLARPFSGGVGPGIVAVGMVFVTIVLGCMALVLPVVDHYDAALKARPLLALAVFIVVLPGSFALAGFAAWKAAGVIRPRLPVWTARTLRLTPRGWGHRSDPGGRTRWRPWPRTPDVVGWGPGRNAPHAWRVSLQRRCFDRRGVVRWQRLSDGPVPGVVAAFRAVERGRAVADAVAAEPARRERLDGISRCPTCSRRLDADATRAGSCSRCGFTWHAGDVVLHGEPADPERATPREVTGSLPPLVILLVGVFTARFVAEFLRQRDVPRPINLMVVVILIALSLTLPFLYTRLLYRDRPPPGGGRAGWRTRFLHLRRDGWSYGRAGGLASHRYGRRWRVQLRPGGMRVRNDAGVDLLVECDDPRGSVRRLRARLRNVAPPLAGKS